VSARHQGELVQSWHRWATSWDCYWRDTGITLGEHWCAGPDARSGARPTPATDQEGTRRGTVTGDELRPSEFSPSFVCVRLGEELGDCWRATGRQRRLHPAIHQGVRYWDERSGKSSTTAGRNAKALDAAPVKRQARR
jgi:hypothetical protein